MDYEHIKYATNKNLAAQLKELARRHVDNDKEVLLEAARRFEAYVDRPEIFNDKAFSV